MTASLGGQKIHLDVDCLGSIVEVSRGPIPSNHLRSDEYAYLDQQGHVYLDYTGASLPSHSQIQANAARLSQSTSGNPHSINPTSQVSNTLIARTRVRVLQFLNANPNEYAVIFTANATAAARLVGESYAFKRGSTLVLTADNHNSVNGLRSFAQKAKARTIYVPVRKDDLRTDSADIAAALSSQNTKCPLRRRCRNLFAFPAQSNFTGVIHPLHWVTMAQKRGYDVLLDAAAYLPTSDLDLQSIKPEFVIMSWYKVFGLPTGVGCLVARRDALATLSRPWFSGGTVDAVSVIIPWHALASDESAFEDGTLNFLSIPDVEVGINWVQLVGRQETAARVMRLTQSLLFALQGLQHTNGQPMVLIYGPTNLESRGGTVAFNLVNANGNIVDSETLALDAAVAKISIRTGCFCNPGVGEAALGLKRRNFYAYIKERSKAREKSAHPRPLGSAVRVSFGIASNEKDVEAIIQLIRRFYRDRRA